MIVFVDETRVVSQLGSRSAIPVKVVPFGSPQSPQAELDSIVGVVEHGLFIRIAHQALVGGPEGVKTLHRESAP